MMQKRKSRRNRKFFGSRSHGKGNVKNKRGSGCKGGVGRAGMHKHRFSYATTYDREWVAHGGRRGFANPTAKKFKVLNVYQIEDMIKSGELKTLGASKVFTLEFNGRILAQGDLNHAVEVRALYATESAIEKIKNAGGKFVCTCAEDEKTDASSS